MKLMILGLFEFVVTLLSEVAQEDCESQCDASQKSCPCHRGNQGKVHCLRNKKRLKKKKDMCL